MAPGLGRASQPDGFGVLLPDGALDHGPNLREGAAPNSPTFCRFLRQSFKGLITPFPAASRRRNPKRHQAAALHKLRLLAIIRCPCHRASTDLRLSGLTTSRVRQKLTTKNRSPMSKPPEVEFLERHLRRPLYNIDDYGFLYEEPTYPLSDIDANEQLMQHHYRKCYRLDTNGRIIALNLNDCGIEDASFIKRLSTLRSLDISDNPITDYSFLRDLSALRSLMRCPH